jgi:dCMP deaminase
MIIGLTGFLNTGKNTIEKILIKKDFLKFPIKEELFKNLDSELKKKEDSVFLTNELIKKINDSKDETNYFINPITDPEYIKILKKKLKNFVLIYIDSDQENRFKRLKKNESKNIKSLNDFTTFEKNNNDLKQLEKCKKLSNHVLKNNKSLDDLKTNLSDLLVKLQIKFSNKPDWNRYFINIAESVSKRGSCLSAQVGVVIVKDNILLSTGYNGAIRGLPDDYQRGYCLRRKLNIPSGTRFEIDFTVHAEQNGIINASKVGVSINGATMYFFGRRVYEGVKKKYNGYPCEICKKMIINAGIVKFISEQEDGTYKEYLISDWVKDYKKDNFSNKKEKYKVDYY